MSLTVVSTPIGNLKDITLNAIEVLTECQAVICEEIRPAETLLKRLKIPAKELLQLNEHSEKSALQSLLNRCKSENIALISDCGTPGFCDPGQDLVELCYKNGVEVKVCPGASSLMAFLSVAGRSLNSFYFAGFLPANTGDRSQEIKRLKAHKCPIIIMETPYRLKQLLLALSMEFEKSQVILGIDLTGPKHQIIKESLSKLKDREFEKLPFVLALLP